MEELVNDIKIQYKNEMSDNQFLEIFEEFVDYVCGKEPADDILQRQCDRLINYARNNKFNEVLFSNKISDFFKMLEKEDNELQDFVKNSEF